jgi:hypothetical protein
VTRVVPAALVALFVGIGSWMDRDIAEAGRPRGILVADLHVHPFPGDGTLTIGQLQREAQRRGLDVIAVSGHNNRVALDLARAAGGLAGDVIVLESQELTAPEFHMIAVGVREMIDWRLSVPEAVRAIHAQGGAAIAAHPAPLTWKPMDAASLRALDGVEVAHPMTDTFPATRRHLDRFFGQVRAVNPDAAPIGSTDFHAGAPIGLCRTYLLTEDRSATGVVEAIRRGRTVAADQDGRLFGAADHVTIVQAHLAEPGQALRPVAVHHKLLALGALLSLAAVTISSRRKSRSNTAQHGSAWC